MICLFKDSTTCKRRRRERRGKLINRENIENLIPKQYCKIHCITNILQKFSGSDYIYCTDLSEILEIYKAETKSSRFNEIIEALPVYHFHLYPPSASRGCRRYRKPIEGRPRVPRCSECAPLQLYPAAFRSNPSADSVNIVISVMEQFPSTSRSLLPLPP